MTMLPSDIRDKLEAAVKAAKEQGLPQSETRLKNILSAMDNVQQDGNSPYAILDAIDALKDIGPAISAFEEASARNVLLSVSAKAAELADEIEHKPEREQQERAAESRRLKQEALNRVLEKARGPSTR